MECSSLVLYPMLLLVNTDISEVNDKAFTVNHYLLIVKFDFSMSSILQGAENFY